MSNQTFSTIHQTDAYSTLKHVETFLLQATIFLIPSNLAYHFYTNSAYINGRLVDYLLLKLYVSDIPILLFILINIFKLAKINAKSIIFNKYIILLTLYLGVISLISVNPLSSTWYFIKYIEYLLFATFVYQNYTRPQFLDLVKYPLLTAGLTQMIISLYQYINHSSLFGYYFLGEPDLKSLGIASVATNHGLEVIPYGTTAHPNVLAGFLTITIVVLLSRIHLSPKKFIKTAVNITITGLFLSIYYLTRSISALSGSLIAFLILLQTKLVSNIKNRVILLIISASTLMFSLIFFQIIHHFNLASDSPSFYERYELNIAAINLIQSHPLIGIGPNLFAQYLPQFPISRQQSYLLQPVHNGLLLILAETGLIGLALIILNLASWFKHTKATKAPISAFLPIITLLVILQFDHYPLTLQTGQLLLTTALLIPALNSEP